MASVWIPWVCALGILACHRAPVAAPSAAAPAAPGSPPAAPAASCNCPPSVDPDAARLIVQAAEPIGHRAIQQLDIDLFEDGKSILSSVKVDRRPAVLEIYGLKARQTIELEVSAKGFSKQRRRIVLAPAENSAIFFLGRPGMDYFQVGDVQIPYSRAQARHVVLMPRPNKGTPEQRSRRLKAYAARVPQVTLNRLELDPARPRWYEGLVVADVTFAGTERGRALSDFAGHLRNHPDDGVIAVLLNEHARGGLLFAGQIEVTFSKLLDPAELARFADRYDLVVTRSGGGQATFTMKAPGVTFQDVIERIRKENPIVTDATPTITAPIEIDGNLP